MRLPREREPYLVERHGRLDELGGEIPADMPHRRVLRFTEESPERLGVSLQELVAMRLLVSDARDGLAPTEQDWGLSASELERDARDRVAQARDELGARPKIEAFLQRKLKDAVELYVAAIDLRRLLRGSAAYA
jgi:hypothetical protein